MGLQLALQCDLDGGGHLEPQQSRGHGGSHVGGADAGGEGSQSSVCTGVGVGPYDDLTGGCLLYTSPFGDLEDQGSIDFFSSFGNALNDLHVIDVESTDCVTAIIGFLEHFCSSNQWHNYHLL